MKVGIEDERKFRVIKAVLNKLENGVEITQGYLCIDPPVRVRIENFEDSFLTIKIKQAPGINLEFEWAILLRDANLLMVVHKYHKIRKIRYKIGRLEVDVFLGELAGLVVIEFEQKYPGEPFEIPADFLVEEITGDARFSNNNLCRLDKIPEEWRCRDVSRSL